MTELDSAQPPIEASDWLRAGGETGAIILAKDWSATPLGPIETWPQTLTTALSICLLSKQPMFVWWKTGDDELTIFYNDAYIPIAAAKHPDQIGAEPRSPKGFPEMWEFLQPLVESVFKKRTATWSENLYLPIYRTPDLLEEAYWSFSYSPIITGQGDAVAGMYCSTLETTKQVLADRRMRLLRHLGTGSALSSDAGVASHAMEHISENPQDVPFALLYLVDADGNQATLAGTSGLGASEVVGPSIVSLDGETASGWPLRDAYTSGAAVEVKGLQHQFGGALPTAPWDEASDRAIILPIASPTESKPTGFLVVGLSPRLRLDSEYESFLKLVAAQFATNLHNARTVEAERLRAEALAQLDHAKTAFFSNVSHEFRTPLTLILGPIEETLARTGNLTPDDRQHIEAAHRNSLRLLKLVNTLLDFSRIEAGRAHATYEPTDLASATTELASVFRSTIEKAGLSLTVECAPLSEPVFVDRDMWEKIVLNLLSNAFKFTLAGGITVKLRAAGDHAELTISDTGVGVSEDEMPRLFERFHRVATTQGRTHEGSGIGLALVQELVKLHGGSIGADSTLGRGTTFKVAIPFGSRHLDNNRIGASRANVSTALGAAPFVEEASRWLVDADLNGPRIVTDSEFDTETVQNVSTRGRILVADDNTDMRDYVVRLLAGRYDVEAVVDGEAALAAIARKQPDLLLSDIMMPRIDGLNLAATLRADPRTNTLPIILLSARAGQESRVEGMEAGADDYLIKPFSGRELLARVEAHLKLKRAREDNDAAMRSSEKRYRELVEQNADGIFVADAEGRFVDVNPAGCDLLGMTKAEVLASRFTDVLEQDEWNRLPDEIARFASGAVVRSEWRFRRKDGSQFIGELAGRQLEDGRLQGVVRDTTDRSRLEYALRESETRFRNMADHAPVMVWVTERDGACSYLSQTWYDFTGQTPETGLGMGWLDATHPDDRSQAEKIFLEANARHAPFQLEYRLRRHDGEYVWAIDAATPRLSDAGQFLGYIGSVFDISERKKAEDIQRMMTGELSHRVKNMLATVQAVASQTFRHNTNPADFVSTFSGRIQSMARIHSMLSDSDWHASELREIIRDQVVSGPVDEMKVTAWGPSVGVPPQAATHVAMMLHELGTNSIKYGALSRPQGEVSIGWTLDQNVLHMTWSERGGPPVKTPLKRGFGTVLIEQSARSAGGVAAMSIEGEGIQWRFQLPLPDANTAGSSGPLRFDALAAPTRELQTGASPQAIAGKRILVIEDEPLVALDIVSMLEQAGAVAESVGTAGEALTAIASGHPDVALLDGNLAGEPVDAIAGALMARNVPFAFVTGYNRENLPASYAGANILNKPFSSQQLVDMVATLINRR